MTTMSKHDVKKNWTYSTGCGCSVTFFGSTDCKLSAISVRYECSLHDGQDDWFLRHRKILREEADESLRQAVEGTL